MKRIARIALCTLLFAVPAFAELTVDQKRTVAKTVAALVDAAFVDEAVAKKIAADLRAKAGAGAFDNIATEEALAAAITETMHAVEDDKHLSVKYAPDKAPMPLMNADEALKAMEESRRPQPGDGNGPRRRPGGSGLPSPEEARRNNYDVKTVRHLDGNIGYLQLDTFFPLRDVKDTLSAAMKVLENTDAMIVDLRTNRGGGQGTVDYLASYFFPPDERLILTMRRRGDSEAIESHLVETPTRNFENKPLYILVSDKTFSAAEAFAYIMQQFGRATVVGEKTKGGGRPNAFLPIGGGFMLSTSIAEVRHPKTGTSWEKTGVIPNVVTTPDAALDAALKLAREKKS
ncbi:MAG TPA: S41 family peptidase [Thermoanaerobaculia bacterium]|jgi:hypothetical protein